MAKTSSEVQEIYIGLLGRAADAEGLAYWTTGGGADLTVEDLRANIVNLQPEYINGMGEMTRGEVVTQLYSNLFSREPDNEGYAYWVSGEGSSVNVDQLVLGLTDGASDADLAVVANKVTAATYYTENAPVYSAETATAAVADVTETAASLTASQAATDAIEEPAPAPTPISGETFNLTANAEDDIIGTSGDDLILGLSANIATTDKVNGGSGDDTLRITATGDVAALDVSSIENVEVVVESFSDVDYDAAETSNATITLIKGGNGFSSGATVDNAGDNVIVAGSGISGTFQVEGNDEGEIHVGDATSLVLSVATAGNDLNFVVTDDSDVAVTDVGVLQGTDAASLATEISVRGGEGTVDVSGMAAAIAGLYATGNSALTDVTLADGAELIIELNMLAAASLTVEGEGTILFEGANAAAALDLEDSATDGIVYGIRDVGVTDIANADGKTFKLTKSNTAGDVTVNTSDEDDGSAFLNVDIATNSTAFIIGTDVDVTNVSLSKSTVTGVTELGLDGEVNLDLGANTFEITTTEIDHSAGDAAFEAILNVTGSGKLTATGLEVSNFNGSAYTGTMIIDSAVANGTVARQSTGSGNDVYTVLAGATDGGSVRLGAGNDTVVGSAYVGTDGFLFDGEAGNDSFTFGTSTVVFAPDGAVSVMGGDGADTLSVNSTQTAAELDLLGNKMSIESVETIVASSNVDDAEIVFAADQLSGDKVTLKGSTTSLNDRVIIASDDNDTTLDFSNLKVDSSLDKLMFEISAAANGATNSGDMIDDKAMDITFTDSADVVFLDAETNTKGVTVDLGAGNDELVLTGATGSVVSITTGAGNDTIVLDETGTGFSIRAVASDAALDYNGAASSTKIVKITDFSLNGDKLLDDTLTIASNTSTTIAVSAATTQADSGIQAAITDGIISLTGSSAGNVDTLEEWLDVAVEMTGANGAAAAGIVGFVFEGSTYVVAADAAADVATNGTGEWVANAQYIVELVGVEASGLGNANGIVSIVAS